MIGWMVRHLGWWTFRLGFTLVACVTLQNIIHQEGYRVELSTLFLASAVTIVTIRFWMPKPECSR